MRGGRDLAGISSDINCRDKKRSRSEGIAGASWSRCLEQLCVTLVCIGRFTDFVSDGIVSRARVLFLNVTEGESNINPSLLVAPTNS